jgi:hypothetical protein
VRPDPAAIVPGCFPVPLILIRTVDGSPPAHIEEFADLQAQEARRLYEALARRMASAVDPCQRAQIVRSLLTAAESWRYQVALAHPHSEGRYSRLHVRRFRDFITDESVNYFPIGEPEKYRDGARWDDDTRSYVGGLETPASTTMRRFASLAARRFCNVQGDVVANEVTLPGGRHVLGTRLLRGAAAARAAAVIAGRIAARGGDGSRNTRPTQGIYVASALQAQRQQMLHAAMATLAEHHDDDAAAAWAWLDAAYLLYQAPSRKRGADATIRTLLVAVGQYLLNRPLTLLHDLDLLAYVHPQEHFRLEVAARMHLSVRDVPTPAAFREGHASGRRSPERPSSSRGDTVPA